jgi:hypothetical protein
VATWAFSYGLDQGNSPDMIVIKSYLAKLPARIAHIAVDIATQNDEFFMYNIMVVVVATSDSGQNSTNNLQSSKDVTSPTLTGMPP